MNENAYIYIYYILKFVKIPNAKLKKKLFDFTGICYPGSVFSLEKGQTKVQGLVKRDMWSQC